MRFFKKEQRKNKSLMSAEALIRQYGRTMLDSVDRCTGERRYIISDLLKAIALRTRQLNMIVPAKPETAMVQLSVYITALVANYVHTGWLRGEKHA